MVDSRSRARGLIMAGEVLVDDHPVTKAGAPTAEDAELRLKSEPQRFVSRGGIKLDGALTTFGLEVEGRVAIDVGASTGGFSDCLLQRGVVKVFAVDVGYGQLAWKLRSDPRVVCIERCNIRYLEPETLGQFCDLAVADVSFISLSKVLGPLSRLLADGADCVLLVKPQFEVGKGNVGSGGVVRDEAVRASAIDDVREAAQALGYEFVEGVDSTLAGPKGNLEHLFWLKWHVSSKA